MKKPQLQTLEEMFRADEWILAPYVKVVVGYNNAVIYDFEKGKAYQISKFLGIFLNSIFNNQNGQELALEQWITKQNEQLSEQLLTNLQGSIENLRRLGAIIPFSEHQDEKRRIPELEREINVKPPYLCTIELTSRCNFHCPHCYLGSKSPSQDLEFNIVRSLLKQIQMMRIQRVQLTGGEIFLREDLEDIIRIAYDLGLEVELTTNGSLISDISDGFLNLLEKFIKKIQITVYGLKEETYSCFSRNPASVLKKVLLAIDMLQRKDSSIIELAFTITPYNYKEVEDFSRFAEEKGLKHKIGKTLPIGLAEEDKSLSSACYTTFIEDMERTYLKKPGLIFRPRACAADKIVILDNGGVTICPLRRKPKFMLGNIYSQSLENIWYQKAIPFLTSLHVDNLEVCKMCELKYLCGGGCPALWQSVKDGEPPCKFYTSRKVLLVDVESRTPIIDSEGGETDAS